MIAKIKSHTPFTLILLFASINLLASFANAKEIQFDCKTEGGTAVGYLINTKPPSVKKVGYDSKGYEVVEFSPTEFVFKTEFKFMPKKQEQSYKNIHNMSDGETYWEEAFIYSINRENLSYQINYRKDTNIIELRGDGWNAFGKCYIIPHKTPVNENYYR